MNTPPPMTDEIVEEMFGSTMNNSSTNFVPQQSSSTTTTTTSNLFTEPTLQQQQQEFLHEGSNRSSAFTQVNPFGQLPPNNSNEFTDSSSILPPKHPHSLHQRTVSVPVVVSRTPPLSQSPSLLSSDSPRRSLQEDTPPMEIKNSLLQQVKDSEPFTTLPLPAQSKNKRHFRFKSTDFGLQQVPIEGMSAPESGVGTPTERSTPPLIRKEQTPQ